MASSSDTRDSSGSGHPIAVAVARLRATAGGVAEQAAWSLSGAQTRDLLSEVGRLDAQVAELEARLLAHAETIGAGTETGATSTATWLAQATRVTRRLAHAKVHLAAAMGAHPATRKALAAGRVLPDQARVVAQAVDAVPAPVREKCERHLLAAAADHDAGGLRTLGRRVLEVVDPDAGEAHEAALLETEEREAARGCRLTLSEDEQGRVHGRFTLSAVHGAMLGKILQGFAAPKHVRATGGTYDHARPSPQRMGQALAELIETYPPTSFPRPGATTPPSWSR